MEGFCIYTKASIYSNSANNYASFVISHRKKAAESAGTIYSCLESVLAERNLGALCADFRYSPSKSIHMRGFMKGFRKSTRIVYWVLRALAISSALLLFSVTGIVALQTATHATGQVMTAPTMTAQMTSSPSASTPSTTPTPIVGSTVVPPTATPQPTAKATQTPPPTRTSPKPPAPTPTPIPPVSAGTPIVVVTATSAAIGPAGPLPPPTPRGTPTAKPSPTPPGSPTPNATGTPVPISSYGNTSGHSNTQSSSNNGIMATIKPLIGPIAGVSTTILLLSAGLFALMFWRKRAAGAGTTPQFQSSSVQGAAPWMNQQATVSHGYAQPTELTAVQNKTMLPFAMQSIVQYSPLLGAPDTSQLDASASPPVSDFRPLSLDYLQFLEVHTDKTPVPVTPAALPALPPMTVAERQPALQLASTQFSPLSAPVEAGSIPPPVQAPKPLLQESAPTAYQFPQHDSFMETLMHQVQMGIFALPEKKA